MLDPEIRCELSFEAILMKPPSRSLFPHIGLIISKSMDISLLGLI